MRLVAALLAAEVDLGTATPDRERKALFQRPARGQDGGGACPTRPRDKTLKRPVLLA